MSEETDGTIAGTEAEAIADASQVETPSDATTEQQEAAAESAAPADDAGEAAEEPVKKVPWFQKRINEVTAEKYELKAEAAYWRGIAEGKTPTKGAEQAQPAAEKPPRKEDFDYDDDAYLQAVIEHTRRETERTLETKLTEREQAKTEAQKNDEAIAKLKVGESKHSDFIAAVSVIKATEAIRDFLLEDATAPSVLYELGKDSAAAERFNKLSPVQQAIELGKRSATPKATPAKTIPPEPVKTVAGLISGASKTPEEMSMAEYAQWVKERDKT
jgi:hypothetical protein